VTANGDIIVQNGGGQWLHFRQPECLHVARTPFELAAVLSSVDGAISRGVAVAGFISYEAASGLDPVLATHAPGSFPLAWFGEYPPPEVLQALPEPSSIPGPQHWRASTSDANYAQAVARIKSYIMAGDTYQVNFTIRLYSDDRVDPYDLFCRLQSFQQSAHAAYVDVGDFVICSASPELFFELDGSRILARPMKGTAPRGMTVDDDDSRAEALRASPKDRAENVMIVDMIRNDLGRIAVPGSVRVTRLFDVERYPTVSQLTSTVEGETHASFAALFGALFPCASITGAPKVRTMQIIRELEDTPRGIYTGSIGYWLPGRQAHFNVAIRTVLVDRRAETLTYGVGGGIVWDSVDTSELAECLTKAAVLNTQGGAFEILETLRWSAVEGFCLLERHVERAKRSASYFGFTFNEARMRQQLAAAIETLDDAVYRVRWLLARDGASRVETARLDSAPGISRVAVLPDSCRSDDPFLYHKTTHRDVYANARKRRADVDDVLLVNERGEITESTLANLVVEIDGERVTPPVSSGLLAGTFRGELLATGAIREGVVTPTMLYEAEHVFLINSVRKWMRVEVVGLRAHAATSVV